MKILHAISTIDACGGGPPRALLGLAKAQAATGLQVTVAATYTAGTDMALADEMRQVGVEVHIIGPAHGPLSRHPDIKPTLARLVAASEIVHIHALWEEIQHQAARIAQQLGKPYIITPHGMLDPWSLGQSRWKKRLYIAWRLRRNLNRAAALHFTSQTEAQSSQALGLQAEAIAEPIGIDLTEFDTPLSPNAFRRRFPTLLGSPLILFLGRVHPGKGLEYLIPAMRHVQPANAKLAIVGPDSGGYMAEMQARADALGIADRMVFTGLLQGHERIAALQDADLFCLPSDHENFGISVVEALAAGTSVIISDQVNIYREIEEAHVGETAPREPEGLAKVLTKWLSDASLRQATSEHARNFAFQTYGWQRIAQRWARHYQVFAGRADFAAEDSQSA